MTAVIALGANLGDRLGTLQSAVDAMVDAGLRIVARSRLYETDPVGGPEQPAYLNAVVIVQDEPEPYALLDLLHRIEHEHGRVRDVRWGARTLDLDVIAVDDVRSDDPVLTLPHPRARERAFVLVPWLDADPDAVINVDGVGRPVATLLDEVGRDGIWLSTGLLRVPSERGAEATDAADGTPGRQVADDAVHLDAVHRDPVHRDAVHRDAVHRDAAAPTVEP